jgi:hypothetical protein
VKLWWHAVKEPPQEGGRKGAGNMQGLPWRLVGPVALRCMARPAWLLQQPDRPRVGPGTWWFGPQGHAAMCQ